MITILVTKIIKIIKIIITITIIVIMVSDDRYESDDSGPGRSSSSSTPYLPANVSDHLIGYLPNFAILFLFSKSSFWYGFYLKNENEKFLFYLKYKENMCGSWFASQFTPPIPPPTNQPNAEIWHINVSVPKTKRWIIQIKNFHFCYQKNKTKQNKT